MIRRVKTENGWVVGLPAADPRITSYKGIPYAAPPVGDNRWRAPQPCADWEGDYEAYKFGPACPQGNCAFNKDIVYSREWSVDTEEPMDEDCLYLNVWAPADGRENLPVFVWYYGGGLQTGFTAEMEFDGERIARRGVVVVTLCYRLNVFGFLCHPEITAEAPDAPANFGLLDQQFATNWVKRNIAAFGGDPNNITIGGQSAGGMSVSAQLMNKDNKGLFRRAIIQSGMFAPPYPFEFGLCDSLEKAEQMGVEFFKDLGVSTLAEARKVDAQKLLDLSFVYRDEKHIMFAEAIDGKFASVNSQHWFYDPDRIKCPVIMGFTSDEFHAAPPAPDYDALVKMARDNYGDRADEFLAMFSQPATPESIARDGDISGIEFGCRAAGRVNSAQADPQPYYLYKFDAEIPGWDNAGTFHSVDLWFFFETLAKCWRPFRGKHYDLSRQMCDYWVNFFRTGDPNGIDNNGEALPAWEAYDDAAPKMMVFGDTSVLEDATPTQLQDFLLEHYTADKK